MQKLLLLDSDPMPIEITVTPASAQSLNPWVVLLLGGFVSAVVTVIANFILTGAEARRKVASEIRQFRANRALDAVTQLRRAYVAAKAELRYLTLSYDNIEHAKSSALSLARTDLHAVREIEHSFLRERQARLEVFNQRGKDLETMAEHAIASLPPFIAPAHFNKVRELYGQFSGTWEAGKENERLQLYDHLYLSIDGLLNEIEGEALAYAESSRSIWAYVFKSKAPK